MAVANEPQQAEVLAWMRRTGGGAMDAARNFFPGASPEVLRELANKYRVWAHRAKEKGEPATPTAQGSQRQSAPPPTLPPPATDVAKMKAIERLEMQVARLAAALEHAYTMGDLRTAVQVDAALAERGAQLDAERNKAARVLRLDRTPTAIALELEKRAVAIRLRAEKERRAKERAAAAQQATKERDL